MGDMADHLLDAVDRFMDNEDDWSSEYYDGWEQHSCGVTCNRCGRKKLHWQEVDGKWRLFDNRGIHVCKANPINLKAEKRNQKAESNFWIKRKMSNEDRQIT